ncbi:hypothetical protein ACLPJK_25715 [Pseudomonas aeruginosa]|uniref:DUF7941 domain-family protein n=1 Tax=Pseudomonas aeruginosa TaxID=287 RepID=UPI003D2CD63B
MSNKQVLVDLINAANPGANVKVGDLVFGVPQAQTGQHNTKLTLEPSADGKFKGDPVEVTYNRVDISAHFTQAGIDLVKLNVRYAQDLIVGLEETYQFKLEAQDVSGAVSEGNVGEVSISPTSLIYTGALSIELVESEVEDLGSVFTVTELSGFTSPVKN